MNMLRPLGVIKRADDGSTSVEFAMILMPLCVILFGSLELGYRIYAQSVINGALREAARMASTGGYTGTQIDTRVTTKIKNFSRNATVAIVKKSYRDFTGVGVAEPVTSGTVDSGTYCFKDINNSGSWEEDQGTSGQGGAEDVVYYEVGMDYKSLFPFNVKYLGMSQTTTVTANTLVSNEPFAAVVTTPQPTLCVVGS